MPGLRASFTQSGIYRASFSQLASDAVLLPQLKLWLGVTDGLNVGASRIAEMTGSNHCYSKLEHQNAESLSRRLEEGFFHQLASASLAKARELTFTTLFKF